MFTFLLHQLPPGHTTYQFFPSARFQPERGGPAIYSAGDVKFYERAYFLGNGQYEADASGYEPSNEPGGAVFNSGTMEVLSCCTYDATMS